ncbi:MAG: Holliday junction resolvase RuvX [Deltaproteobacteria bacterium]|nr:Holliday junction resolvase RuvX [Deltaproteobacteria bacterium]
MKRLGIDLGARRIGVAVHSEEGVPARPLETLVLSEPTQAVNAVVAVALREAAEEVVVGCPQHGRQRGDEGPPGAHLRRAAGPQDEAPGDPLGRAAQHGAGAASAHGVGSTG